MKNKSKTISYLLRHNPEDLKMDKYGYVLISDLLKKLDMSEDELLDIVTPPPKKKKRFEIKGDKIKASQGHSIDGIILELDEVFSPKTYYHGTAKSNLESIMKKGLLPMKRHHVHLSSDLETATSVGMRYAKRKHDLVILSIDGEKMAKDGYKVYKSANDVILIENVPSKYITNVT